MTIRQQYMIAMITMVILTVVITAGFSTWIVDNQFEAYVESEYTQRVEEVKEFAVRYLKGEIRETSGELKASVLQQLGSPVVGFALYDSRGESVLSAQSGRGRGNPMGGMHHMGGASTVTDTYLLNDGDQTLGVIELYRIGEITATENIWIFKIALRRGVMMATVAVIILAVLLSAVLSGRLTRDLRSTAQMAGKMHGGDLDFEEDARARVLEVREIQETLRSLGAKLKLQERIRRERVDQLSHEARTPLAVLQTNLEGALDEVLDMDGPRINKCLDEVRNLTGLFDDLERVIDVEAQAMKVQLENLDIAREIQELILAMEPVLGTRNQTLRYEGPERLNWDMDQGLFKQILYNLVSNSHKYSPDSTEIMIKLKNTSDGQLYLSVADQGPGLTGEELEKVFEPYFRGSQRHGVKGTGLGLYIVKNAVEALQGTISVSEGRSRGAEFVIVFPKH